MIAAIRISGLIKMKQGQEENLNRMRLRKKFSCVILDDKKPEIEGMIKKARNFIAYGEISEKTLAELIKARGKIAGNKKAKVKDHEKIAKDILAGKKMEELGLKPFFGLHPARGGIDTKHHFPKGVLGNHGEQINKLIEKML